ncbi:serine/threonine-protein kinase [Nannocystis bainbridge]|uniref:Serine/threonine-protein kinase n=1 Tax=Nannocystis bainbridge TaxID=2995303 RepID=A0ABT5DSC5_9BACT|nr:serine/threonine-protein kinase [Nannocystis bainbridge]MDC0716545.1 serine/threonine-protein kinase [Nannocystis bainbridge]
MTIGRRSVDHDERTLLQGPQSSGRPSEEREALLGASETLPAGSDGLAATGDGAARPTRVRGSVVGRYVVLSLLGTGGMGAVYAAHDPELDRKVALKLLRPDASPGEAARMIREARALARLSHPNVVAVHDVGVVGDGEVDEVFIAMEFVDGATLRGWLRQRSRSLREIVEVFAAAARGLAAAHAVDLVHRDFKPDNVMVGRDGRVRVMDFGLARAGGAVASREPSVTGDLRASATDVRLTRAGTRLGTPAYMAPEQWMDDEVDARTDQFALCVALWEALYGERPFRGESVHELMFSVTEGPLGRPPEGPRRVPGWLGRVLERGLARSPSRRFESMEALLVELERGLARQRRRPLLFGLLAVGLVAAGVLGLRARSAAGCAAAGREIEAVWHERARAGLHAALLATGAPFAETSFQKAVPRIDRWAGAWAELRTQVCTEAEVDGSRPPALYRQAVACLDERREALAALLEVFTSDSAANVQRLVPAMAGLAALEPCAEKSYLERMPAPPDDAATRERVHGLRRELQQARGRLAAGDCGGLTQAEAMLAAAEALPHPPLVVAARDLVADLAECGDAFARAEAALRQVYVEAEAQRADEVAAGAAIQLVATIGRDRARAAEALQWALPAEVIVQRLGETRGLLGASLAQNVARVHASRGEYEQALAGMEQALAIREELLGPDHPTVATALDVIGGIHRSRESLDAALAAQTRALAIRREALGADHPAVGVSANNLGLLEQQRGNYDAALPLLEEAVAVAEHALGPDDLEVGTSLNNLGRLQHVRGRYAEARTLLTRALAIREARLGPSDLDVAVTLQNLGLLELLEGNRLAARELLQRVLTIRERKLDEAHPEVVAILDSLGTLNYRIGSYAEAQALHERALAIQQRMLPAGHPDIASSLRNLALVRAARGEREAALAQASEAATMAEQALGPSHPDLAPMLNTLGLLQRRGDPTAAVATLERALAISARARGRKHPATGTSLLRLGEAHLARGALTEAEASLSEALAIREGLGRETPEVAEVLVALGELELARGQSVAAVPVLERAVQIRSKGGIAGHQRAEAQFHLARALAPNDPPRSRELAQQAAATLREAGPGFVEELAAVEAWLRP